MLPASESPLLAGATARAVALVEMKLPSTDGSGAAALVVVLKLPLTFAEGGAGGGGGLTVPVLAPLAVVLLDVLPPAVTPGAAALALMLGAMALWEFVGLGGMGVAKGADVLLLPGLAMTVLTLAAEAAVAWLAAGEAAFTLGEDTEAGGEAAEVEEEDALLDPLSEDPTGAAACRKLRPRWPAESIRLLRWKLSEGLSAETANAPAKARAVTNSLSFIPLTTASHKEDYLERRRWHITSNIGQKRP